MEINEENCKSFGNRREEMKFWIITLQFQLKKQNKQTKKYTNLNRFMWQKLLNQKKKVKKKWINNNNDNNNNNNNNNNNSKKEIKRKEKIKRD